MSAKVFDIESRPAADFIKGELTEMCKTTPGMIFTMADIFKSGYIFTFIVNGDEELMERMSTYISQIDERLDTYFDVIRQDRKSD